MLHSVRHLIIFIFKYFDTVLKITITVLLFREEAQEYIEIGTINGLFVLGRCTGFIGTSS